MSSPETVWDGTETGGDDYFYFEAEKLPKISVSEVSELLGGEFQHLKSNTQNHEEIRQPELTLITVSVEVRLAEINTKTCQARLAERGTENSLF